MANPWDKPTAAAAPQGKPWDKPTASADSAPASPGGGHDPALDNAPQGNSGFFEGIQDAYDSAVARPPQADLDKVGPIGRGLANFGRGVMELEQPLMHPIKTAQAALPHSVSELAQDVIAPGSRMLGNMVMGGVQDAKEHGIPEALEHGAGQVAGGVIAGETPGMIGDAGGALRDAAIGDPDAAALRGLQIGPRSDAQIDTVRSIQNSRPYLKGATSQAKMQARIPGAMDEVWNPYKQAVEAIGDRPVKFDGMPSTIRQLEAERLRLSALNRGVKAGNPSDIQQVMQEGRTPAQLIEREEAVKAALDPHLASTGIDPRLIRDTYGSLADVRSGVEGKLTVNEKPRPSGLGRMMNMRLTEPKTLIGEPIQGMRDLAAGRPLWSAKPTDLGIKEGFRMGGPKPNLGSVQTTGMAAPPRGLLPAPPREMPAPAYNGRVEDYQPPPVDASTTPIRMGRLLPDKVPARELPMSSYHEIFPEQLPNSRLIDFLNRSK